MGISNVASQFDKRRCGYGIAPVPSPQLTIMVRWREPQQSTVYNDLHATTYQNGQLTDLSSKVG